MTRADADAARGGVRCSRAGTVSVERARGGSWIATLVACGETDDADAVPGRVCDVTAPGFEVPAAAMRGAADGIDALVGELGSLTTAGRAGEGRGVPGVELGADQLGHEGLAAAFAQFCLRWDWGVRALVQDGSGMADGLRETVQSYEEADDGAGAVFSRMFDMVLGDPAGDPGSATGSPGEVLSGAADDYLSGERWSQAGTSMTDTWSDVAQDLTETAQDRAGRAAAGENPYGPELDALREIVD